MYKISDKLKQIQKVSSRTDLPDMRLLWQRVQVPGIRSGLIPEIWSDPEFVLPVIIFFYCDFRITGTLLYWLWMKNGKLKLITMENGKRSKKYLYMYFLSVVDPDPTKRKEQII